MFHSGLITKARRILTYLSIKLGHPLGKNAKTFVAKIEESKTKFIKPGDHCYIDNSDIYHCSVKYGFTPEEYFRYELYFLSEQGRRQYVSDSESDRFFSEHTTNQMYKLFREKYQTYCHFAEYYQRDIIQVRSEEDREKFYNFIESKNRIVVKPIAFSGGRGVQIINISEIKDRRHFVDEIVNKHGAIIEEVIEQDERMKRFHPQSINTIRIVTCNNNGVPFIIYASIRIGVGDSIVDNGCLTSAVDIESGIISTIPRMVHCSGTFVSHPDTGIQILGVRIPEWEKVKALAIQLSSIVPEQIVIGWDLALSVKGWIVVEANTSPAIQTLAGYQIGARKIFDTIKAAF